MRDRLIGSLLLGLPIVGVVAVGGVWTALAVMFFLVMMTVEYVHLVARRGHRVFGGLMLAWAVLFILHRIAPGEGLLEPGMAMLLIMTLAWALIRYRQGTANSFTGFGLTIAGALYFGWSLAHFISLRALENGMFWTLTVLCSVWGTDTFAYLVGRALGRNKLIPDISPGKTWEGYLGAMILTPLAVAGLTLLWRQLGAGEIVAPEHGLLIGLLVSTISPVGDVGMSMLKRYTGVKDSSQLIPGHGGFLDRTDSIIIGVLLGYYYLTLFVL